MKHFLVYGIILQSMMGFSQSDLAKKAMLELEADSVNWSLELIAEKVDPNYANESILVLPMYTEYQENYFTLKTWIVRVDSQNGTIKNKQFLHHESDAIVLSGFLIDTAPYQISSETRAFGIRTTYRGSSKPNPYTCELLSLYVNEADSFSYVLKDFEVGHYIGEWNMICNGHFISHAKKLILLEKSTNGYFEILVKDEITDEKTFVDNLGECESKSTISIEKRTLRFIEGKYQEVH